MIVLPPALYGRVGRQDHRKWLGRGRLQLADRALDMIVHVLAAIGHAVPAEGLAALRYWGQTGQRPGAWIAAADPVHLQAQLDHLSLHTIPGDTIANEELQELFAYLDDRLGVPGQHAFLTHDRHGYLQSTEPMVTATVSPLVVDRCQPDDFMPDSQQDATHDRLLGEVQLALHEHDVNLRRMAAGRLAVNSLWLWGGGLAPEVAARSLPALFASDPLFRGYWHSCDAAVHDFAGDFSACIENAAEGFVAVTAEPDEHSDPDALQHYLSGLRRMLRLGQVRRMSLVFRDGLVCDIGRADALRIWRRVPSFLMEAEADG